MITIEEEKAIEIDDKNDQQTDDEATVIVNETLKEIQEEQMLTQGKGKEMVETQMNTEAPSSSRVAEKLILTSRKSSNRSEKRMRKLRMRSILNFLKRS